MAGTGGAREPTEDPLATVCSCMSLTLREITGAMRANDLRTVEDVARHTRASTGCGGCKPELAAIVARQAEVVAEPLPLTRR